MGLFRVQYGAGPTLEIPAINAEEALDTYKVKANVRRDRSAELAGTIKPPVLEEIKESNEKKAGDGLHERPTDRKVRTDSRRPG